MCKLRCPFDIKGMSADGSLWPVRRCTRNSRELVVSSFCNGMKLISNFYLLLDPVCLDIVLIFFIYNKEVVICKHI